MKEFTLQQAIELATTKHEGQLDRGGKAYINHPLAVMRTLHGEQSQMVGVLHDIVEDTDVTLNDLTEMGCPSKVVEAIGLVTHPADHDGSDESYMRDVKRIVASGNQLAIDTKWADLTHNSDLSRIPDPTDKDRARVAKYARAKELLKPYISNDLVSEDG